MLRFKSIRLAGVMLAAVALAACDDETVIPDQPVTIAATAANTADLSTLVTALQAANLVTTLEGDGPFTVFAPLNSAFAALDADVLAGLLETGNVDLLSRILTFHVVPGAAALSTDLSDGQTLTTVEGGTLTVGLSGGGVTINGANVITADVEASNGVVHIIDAVLLPEGYNAYETAVLTAGTTTLASAVLAAGLDDDLAGTGPFTIFAPDNAAFAALDAYTLGALLDAGNIDILNKVLGFHVIAGQTILAADLTDGAMVTTLQGGDLTVDLSDATDPKVNGVSITATDIAVENGVIHLVDEVILPEFNIVETASITEGFSTLVAAVAAGDLVTTLSDEMGTFTVFAPTNAAFEALGGTVDALLETANQGILVDVLTYHVLDTEVGSGALTNGLMATTVEGGDITFDLTDPMMPMVNGANITATDIQTSNGVIHVIDAVLTQSMDVVQRAIVTEDTGTLVDAVVAGDLVTTLSGAGPFTVFAPVNAAFEALGMTAELLLDPGNQAILQDVLTYHVIPSKVMAADLTDGAMVTTVEGGDVTIDLSDPTMPMVNGAKIIATDIVTENGVIHLIDGVLTESMDIVERALVTPETGTLAFAVTEADLVSTLQGPGPFTVFAPVGEAFEALGGSLDLLLEPANQAILQDILTYHVIPGEVFAADLTDGAMVTTVEGGDVTIDLSDPTMPMVNGAKIIATDIVTENGVIHLIDAVLTESVDIVERAIITPETATLVDAVVAGDLVTTLQGAGPFTVFAPINAAFEALGTDQLDVLLDPANIDILQKVLTYHVIPGEVFAADLTDGAMVTTVEGSDVTIDLSDPTMPMVNGANIIATDIVTENGVIHLIDGVLTENLNLVDVAVVNGFSTLVDLVAQQGLAGALSADNADLTVFAPTNEAFAALSAVPQGQALTDVLTYHVLDAIVESGDLSDGLQVSNTLLQGGAFTVNISGSDVTITDGAGNTVNVIVTDVRASNGIIHVIDAVLLPTP